MVKTHLFTSESVSEGHPDKICDQISDAILDLHLSLDSSARVAVETMVTPNKVILAGETKTSINIDKELIDNKVREIIKKIGYEQKNFHWNKVNIENLIIEQSPDISVGVTGNDKKDEGAGDQGIMFGFACNETEHLMPAPIYYSHKILQNIFAAIKSKQISDIGPDAKSQVTLLYQNGIPIKAKSVVVSIQHKSHLKQKDVKELILPFVKSAFPNNSWMPDDEDFYVNPTGIFTIGGPESDAGLTGRKIIVDTYGGAAPHGGGAFSGKDSTKVDRSAAYAARYLAKNVVASGLSEKCLIQLSYAIGISKPLSFYIKLQGDNIEKNEQVAQFLQEHVDLTPKGIRKHLGLNQPIYTATSTYGHFGRIPESDGHFSWEKLDLQEKLKERFC